MYSIFTKIIEELLTVLKTVFLSMYERKNVKPKSHDAKFGSIYEGHPLYASRQMVLRSLEQEIGDQVHVIKIYGPDGIGKVIFAVHLYYCFKKKKKYIPFMISADIHRTLSGWAAETLVEDQNKIQGSDFWECLKKHRCFVVVRHAEQLAHGTESEKNLYADLKSKLCAEKCKSILVLLYNERIHEIENLENKKIVSFSLEGLDAGTDKARIKSGLQSDFPDDFLEKLFCICDGYPELLEREVMKLRNYHADKLKSWEKNENYRNIYDKRVEEKVKTLSEMEKQMLHWLALHSPRSETNLMELMNEESVRETARSLEDKFLIDRHGEDYTIRNTVKHCLQHRIIENAVNAVKDKNIRALDEYLLYEACSHDSVRRQQEKEIIGPVLEKLKKRKIHMELTLKEMLRSAGRERTAGYRYAVANVLNLLICSGSCLDGEDLSGMEVGQVNFEEVSMRNVDLRDSDLKRANFREPLDMVTSCAFHPGGKYFVTGGIDGKIIFWDNVTRQKFNYIQAHRDTIWKISFSDDGKYLASCGNDSGFHIWNAEYIQNEDEPAQERKIEAEEWPKSWLTCMDWKGDLLVTAGGDGKIFCCDFQKKKLWKGYTGQDGTYHCLRFSPDGKLIMAGNNYGIVQTLCFDMHHMRYEVEEELHAHNGQIGAIAFLDASGKELLTGGADGNLIRWSRAGEHGWEKVWEISAHEGLVTGIALAETEGSKIIVTCGHDGRIHKWDESGNPLNDGNLKGHSGKIHAISALNNRLLTSSSDVSVRLWDINGGAEGVIHGSSAWINGLALYGNGKYLAAGCADASVQLWDLGSNKMRCPSLKGNNTEVIAVAVSPDEQILAVGSADGKIILRKLPGGEILACIHEAHAGAVRGISFLEGIYHMISVSSDENVKYWKFRKNADKMELEEPKLLNNCFPTWLGAVAVNPSSEWIAYTVRNGIQISRSDDRDIEKERFLAMPGLTFQTAAFSPDNRWFSAAGDDGIVYLWDMKNGWERKNISVGKAHIGTICFSPDSHFLAAAGGDGCLKLINMENVSKIWEEKIFSRSIHCAIFSRNGEEILLAGADGHIARCRIKRTGDVVFGMEKPILLCNEFDYSGMKFRKGDLPRIRANSLICLGACMEEKE